LRRALRRAHSFMGTWCKALGGSLLLGFRFGVPPTAGVHAVPNLNHNHLVGWAGAARCTPQPPQLPMHSDVMSGMPHKIEPGTVFSPWQVLVMESLQLYTKNAPNYEACKITSHHHTRLHHSASHNVCCRSWSSSHCRVSPRNQRDADHTGTCACHSPHFSVEHSPPGQHTHGHGTAQSMVCVSACTHPSPDSCPRLFARAWPS
jgi:hypothetical protein